LEEALDLSSDTLLMMMMMMMIADHSDASQGVTGPL
jgi:hypothetical protein